MKDSYDPLDWNNSSKPKGYQQYSADDYERFANNPTYRSDDSYTDHSQGYDRTYDENYYQQDTGYDNTYDQGYDQSYDNSYYQQGYDNTYSQGYDNSYQQTSSGFYDPNIAKGPVQYSQQDYDYMASNPSNLHEDPNRMDAEQFFDMVHEQDRRKQRQEQLAMLALTSKSHHLYRTGEMSGEFDKDIFLYLLGCAVGAAVAKLLGLPLYAYPFFAGVIGLVASLLKKNALDSTPFSVALKECILEFVLLFGALIASLVMFSKGMR